MTTRRHTRQMKRGRGSLRPIRTLVRERGGDRASVQERAGILRGGDSIPEQNVQLVYRAMDAFTGVISAPTWNWRTLTWSSSQAAF